MEDTQTLERVIWQTETTAHPQLSVFVWVLRTIWLYHLRHILGYLYWSTYRNVSKWQPCWVESSERAWALGLESLRSRFCPCGISALTAGDKDEPVGQAVIVLRIFSLPVVMLVVMFQQGMLQCLSRDFFLPHAYAEIDIQTQCEENDKVH